MDAPVPNSTDQSKEAPPAAYFQSLTVENLRCFGPAQTLRLADNDGKPYQWTIILGDNGVGKTTLLQCLALQHFITVFGGGVFKTYGQTHPAIAYAPNGPIFPRQKGLTARVKCEVDLRHDIATDDTLRGSYSIETKSIGTGAAFLHSMVDDHDSLICYAYGASRRMGTISLYDDNRPDTWENLFSDNSGLLSPIEWLLTTDYSARLDGNEKGIAEEKLRRVTAAITKLLPEVEGFQFERSSSTGRVEVAAKVPYGWVSINELSLGYKTSLTWMVDLADRLINRYPYSDDPLAEPAIVLIDEIDLHLHPQWQRQIVEQLTEVFKKTQFIVTAHSPLVVQAAQDANIVLLKREGDYVVIDDDYKAVRNWRVDQILTSDLFGLPTATPPQLDAAMEERTQILEKPQLTDQDNARLNELRQEIGSLPGGDTPEDIHASDLIRRAAKLLERSGGKSL